ncbi:unnamed protein product [Ectocarpus sp. CCAP 1310/34]|nr:unnamed protein product [Ectocarpus sp. CCAP 1310/34]
MADANIEARAAASWKRWRKATAAEKCELSAGGKTMAWAMG